MQHDLHSFLSQLRNDPSSIAFQQSIDLIDQTYHFQAQAFTVGAQVNAQGQNQGSCKLLAFGKTQQLSVEETLMLFGHFYRQEVLGNPDGQDHQNIRQLRLVGWSGVSFAAEPLTAR